MVETEDNLPPQILGSSGNGGQSNSRKKLLVLDVNGLLVDIVAEMDESQKPDTVIASKAVFKRPFCDEFLKFCFERFSVGVWTSRTRKNIDRVLDFLMRDTQHQLLFCWDQSHCTETGFNTIENTNKPLLLKELKRLWEKQDPSLPWDRGVYDESNTVLLDDSPYKALRNPPYTAIFPNTYSYRNAQDNGLGPNGDLRNYLERLAASDNVQKFIEQNPFGQQPITHDNESWNFYHKIICSTQPGAGPSRSRKKLIVIDLGGLLIEAVTVPREGFRADTIFGSRAVFKRPYCDEFLRFCFKRFNVGVWTSTPRYNTERALDFLMRDTKHKLLFCWDVAHCTDTGFVTIENDHKKILLKEIRKLWEKKDPNLPWELGEYDESNTLLVDNAPHRALLNPPHTAIFPYRYRHWHSEDNSLGPKGDLRIYLERLAASENVQKFVSENFFGQRPISKKNLSWRFYQKVIHAFSYKCKGKVGDSVDAQCKNSSEPKPDTTTASVTKSLSEPKTHSNTDLAAQALLELKTVTTTSLVGQRQTILEPDLDTTALDSQTSLEPEIITTTILTAPTLLEPGIDTTTALVGQTLLELRIGTTTYLVGQTLSEPDIDGTTQAAQTSLESETITTTVLTAPTLLEPEIGSPTTLVGQTLSEPEIHTTAPAAQTLLETETFTSDVGATLSAKNKSPPKRIESNYAVNSSVTCSMNKSIVKSAEDNSCVKRLQSSAGSNGNTKVTVSVTGTSGSDKILQDSPPVEHEMIITQTGEAEDGKISQKIKRGRQPKLQTNEAEDGKSDLKRKRGRPPKLVDSKRTSGADDGESYQKKKSPPKSVEGNTNLDGKPLSVLYEEIFKTNPCSSPPDHHDTSRNQPIVTTTEATTNYQQDWPFIKQCPIWPNIESLLSSLTPHQKPHFSPLNKANEPFREGLAIAHIVTYWNLIRMLQDLNPDDTIDTINKCLEALVDLEPHGFELDSVKGCLHQLLCLKSEDTLKELEKCNDEKRVMEEETDRLKVEMQKLQERLAQAENMQKAKEEEIMRLQSKLAPSFQPNQ